MKDSIERVLALPEPDPSFARVDPWFMEMYFDPHDKLLGPSSSDGLAILESCACFARFDLCGDLATVEPWARATRTAAVILGLWADSLDERVREMEVAEGVDAPYPAEVSGSAERAIEARRDLIATAADAWPYVA